MVIWTKNKETESCLNSDKETHEFLSQLIFGDVVSMFSKFLLLLIMIFQQTDNFIFIELVVAVDLEEKVLLLILSETKI
jgi:hypothetical protein